MSEVLSWVYELHDRISGPARSMGSALEHVRERLEEIPKAIAAAEMGIHMLVSGLEKVAHKGFEFGEWVVESMTFKENTLTAFETMLGTKEKALSMFDLANRMADFTPFTTERIASNFEKLVNSGFSEKQIPILFQALGDVSSAKGFSQQVMDGLAYTMSQVNASGFMDMHTLRESSHWGINRQKLLENIAKYTGEDPKAMAGMVHGLHVESNVALNAMLDTIKQVYSGGGELGQGMLNHSKSITGLWSTIIDRLQIFNKIDLDTSPAFIGLKKFVQEIADVLLPTTAAATRFRETLFSVADEAGNWLGSFTPQDITAGFEKLVDLIEIANGGLHAFKSNAQDGFAPFALAVQWLNPGADAANSFATAMGTLGYVVGLVAGAIALVGTGIEKFFAIPEMLAGIDWSYLWEQLKDAGMWLVQGFAMGIIGAGYLVAEAVVGLGTSAIHALSDTLKIHSPSRIFQELGAFTSEGFAIGVEAKAPRADEAIESLGSARPTARLGGTVTGNTINISIHVEGGGKDADAVARKLADVLPSRLNGVLEQLSIEGGSA